MCRYLAPSGTYRMTDRWRIQYPMAGTYLYTLFRWNRGLGYWVFDRYLTEDEAGRFYE